MIHKKFHSRILSYLIQVELIIELTVIQVDETVDVSGVVTFPHERDSAAVAAAVASAGSDAVWPPGDAA